jgi:hypothetical protein
LPEQVVEEGRAMIGPARLIAVVFAPCLLCQSAAAKPEHYVVDSFGDTASGYAELETSSNGSVTGQICAYIEVSLDSQRDERLILGTIKVAGKRDRNTMQLQFLTDEGSKLKQMLPNGTVKFTSDKVDFFGSSLPRLMTWQNDASRKGAVNISFSQIPDTISASSDDRYTYLGNSRKKFDLAKFDKMSVDQALAFMPTLNLDDIVDPSFVNVVYSPKNRQRIADYLHRLLPAAHLVSPAIPDCGSPFIEDVVRVPSLLELYFSRQLQISGLVARAYPPRLPKAPPFAIISLRAPTLVADITSPSLAFDQKDAALASFFESQLKAFLSAKRPKFHGTWEVEQRNSGAPLAYRAHVTGASISQCQATGWEQFDIQLLLTSFDSGLSVDLQVVQGFQAPGSLSERPPDTRFKDNPLSDDRLEKIQDSFISFLKKRGITTTDPEIYPTSDIACPL